MISVRSRFLVAAPALFVALFFAAFAAVGAQRRPARSEPSVVSVRLPVQSPDQGYTGEERCRSCHRAEMTEFHKTTHAHVFNDSSDRSGQQMNCESCHGPGKAHSDAVEAARGDEALTAAANRLVFAFRGTAQQNTARCLTCHVTSRSQQRSGHSLHAGTAVACQSCHATHLVEAVRPSTAGTPPVALAQFFSVPELGREQRWLRESLLKDSQPALCYGCHASARAQFSLPFHHRVPEGSMKCTDCHNAHGTQNRASLAGPDWETCTSCHVDKHGPFVFEHAAVRVEGCAVCHTPHGSLSRFLLNRREARFLCLQCHGDTHSEQVGVPHGRLGFQTRGDCTRCHVTIHGSNFNEFFLQ